MNKPEGESDKEFEHVLAELEAEAGFTLQDFNVEYPGEDEISRTIHAMRPFMPVKSKAPTFGNLTPLLSHTAHQLLYMSTMFWLSHVLFLMLYIFGIFLVDANPYIIMTALAPLPMLTGLFEIARSRNKGMAELEASLKFNLQDIIISKFVFIGLFTIVLNLMVTILISTTAEQVNIWKLVLYWITPFTVAAACILIFIQKIRKQSFITICLALWMVLVIMVNEVSLFEQLEEFLIVGYLIVFLVAACALGYRLINLCRGGITYEFNH